MLYDVVCSIYEDRGTDTCQDILVDLHTLCSNLETKDDAMHYIVTHNCRQYDHCCTKNEYTSIEIEVHQNDGRIVEVITVD